MSDIATIKQIILAAVFFSAPILLIIGMSGEESALKKFLTVWGAFLCPLTACIAMGMSVALTAINNSFVTLLICIVPLFIFGCGVFLIAAVDEMEQLRKWCGKLCGIAICLIALFGFLTVNATTNIISTFPNIAANSSISNEVGSQIEQNVNNP